MNDLDICVKTELDYWKHLAKNLAYYLSSALVSAQYSMTEETLHDALGLCHQAHSNASTGLVESLNEGS